MNSLLSFKGATLALVGLSGALGAALVHFDTAPYRATKSLVEWVNTALFPDEPTRDHSYPSIFVRLAGQSVPIELSRPISGGGMTQFGDGVLLLAGDGTFVHATSADDVSFPDIEAPANGFADYLADAQGRFAHLEHAPWYFRYNDVLAIDTAEGSTLVASFTRYYRDDACYVNAVARLDLPPGGLSGLSVTSGDWRTLYEASPCLPLKDIYRALEGHIAGGRIAYDGDGHLLLGSGEYTFDGIYAPFQVSQDDAFEYGKLVRIALDGSGYDIVGKGLRNMQGVVWFDDAAWAVEHGMRGGDELNRIVEGRNYGWPLVSMGTQYNGQAIPGTAAAQGRHDGFEPPVYAWLPSVAISSLNVMESVHPTWNGDLLMGSLSGQSLFRIRLEDERVLFAERIPVGERVRYAQPVDGGVVLWTDNRELVFLEASDFFDGDPVALAMNRMDLSDDERAALSVHANACQECHSVTPGDHQNAPSLALLFGRRVAATGYDGYSASLRAVDEDWTLETLQAYLDNPQSFAPGTSMPDPNIDDPQMLANLARLVEELSRTE